MQVWFHPGQKFRSIRNFKEMRLPTELFSLFPSKKTIRIEKLLSSQGLVSVRQESLSFLRHNEVKYKNTIVKKMGTQIEMKNGQIEGVLSCNGKRLDLSPLHLVMNKPSGVIVSRSE